MKKSNRSNGRRRVAAKNRRSSRAAALRIELRWLLIICVAIACLGLFAARNGAQQVDSGWAVASPSPLATGSPNAEQDLIIRHVLEQTHQPLLKHPPSAAATVGKNRSSDDNVRFAARPDGSKVDGWRAAGPSFGPGLIPAQPQNDGTPQTATAAPAKRNFEVECDWSGTANPTERNVNTSRLPSIAAPTLPRSPTPAVEEQTTDVGASIEAATKDDEPAPTPATSEPAQVHSNDSVIGSADASASPTPAKEPVNLQPQPAVTTPPATAPAARAPITIQRRAKAPAIDTTPVTEMPPLPRQMVALKNRVRTVLKGYYRKALNSKEHDPWEAMHGMLAYGVHSRIHDGGPNGQLITCVGWLCYNKPCKGQTLLYVTPSGELRAKYGVGLQGHLGQFLAMLAQCHVSPDYPIHVGDHEFTVKDLIEAEKKTCYPKSELTFKLIALQHYADLDDRWVNDQGVEWDFSKLISEELAQPIRGAACGGTHRLSGLSLAVKTRLRRGEPLDGEYAKADEFVKKYQQYAFRLQNRDGSLSTAWFRGAGDEDDINRRIKTTGHILEWLCYSLSDEQLRQPQTVRAVTYLANLMYSNYDNEWEIGPRSHATHALLLYDQRVFQPYDKEGEMASYRPQPTVARKSPSSSGTMRR